MRCRGRGKGTNNDNNNSNNNNNNNNNVYIYGLFSPIRDRGSTVVKVLCYKSEGRWFDPSWCHWHFSLT